MTISQTKPFDFDVSRWGELPTGPGLLVTGTDTEVGKTLIAGAIARVLHRNGRVVDVFKPVATGCRRDREGLISSDAEFLGACAESTRTLAEINPVRYAAAVAPNIAAERAHRKVDLQAIFDAYIHIRQTAECVIVEGIGGLLCPITDNFWMIHLAKMMNLPLIIVVRAGLGTINHTLLTLHAARSANLPVAGVIINRYQIDQAAAEALEKRQEPYTHGDADLAVYTNPAQIVERGQVELLAIVPQDGESSVELATLGFDVEFAIKQVDWQRIMGL